MVGSVSANPLQSPLLSIIKRANTNDAGPQVHHTDTVHKTSLPKLIQIAAQLAQDGPPIDFVKIAQVRRAIADGSFQVCPDQIAEIMMQSGSNADQFK